MSYTVLARKWRPQTFDEVVGQRHVVQTLKNALSMKRIAHAYLFSGVRGVGKTTVARLLAKALNCEKGITNDICNHCVSCQEISDGISMDVIEIDGASNTGVDDVRDIKESVRYMPAKGRYKVYIIDEVHMLSTSAFNALLKTLEEPPAHTVFILATTEHHKIPLTIISRCQHFNFRRLTTEEVKTKLKVIADAEEIKAPDEAMYLISKEAEGSIRDAQSLLDQVISYSGMKFERNDVVDLLGLIDKELLLNIVQSFVERDAQRVMELIDEAYNCGYDEKRLCQNLLELVRDLSVMKRVKEPEKFLDVPSHEIKDLQEIVNSVANEELHLYFNYLSRGLEEISRATYSRVVLEMVFLKIVGLPPLQSLSDIIARLVDLEHNRAVTVPASTSHAIGARKIKDNRGDKMPLAAADDTFPGNIEKNVYSAPPETRVARQEPQGETKKVSDWEGFLKYVFKKKPALGSQLKSAAVLSRGKKNVVLGLRNGYQYDYLSDKDALESLEDLCNSYFKESLHIEIEELPHNYGESASIDAVLDKKNGVKESRDKKLKDSFIRDVTEVFGGDIHEITE
jgi:DNA polymerase-3 subunit gamma/tau